MSLLFSSHLLPDVEAVCEDVVVLGRGRLLAQGRIEELKEAHDRQYELRVKGDQRASRADWPSGGSEASPHDDHLLVNCRRGRQPPRPLGSRRRRGRAGALLLPAEHPRGNLS